jgi:putative CocE/NonD family hydrolase
MGDSIKFWKDLMSHPNYDAWWKARDVRANVQFISQDIPTLVVGGLYDAEDCYGAWNLYKAIEKKTKNNNKIVMGPWYHGQWARTDGSFLGNVQWGSNTSEWYGKNVELPFFNYYLKQKGNIDQLQEATIFFSGSNEWKQLPKWPLDQVSYESYALRKGGYLSKAVPLIAPLSSWQEYTSDPAKPVPYTEDVHFGRTREYMTDDQRFAARRPDVLVFQTEPLENNLTLAGPITADLMVAISGTDADFVVKLIDVFPDDFKYEKENGYVMNGYQMLVRGEVMRGKFRNSFEKPEPFVPNKPTRVKYELPDVAHTFKKGHRLMIQVQSSWFPLVDRNPQQFMDIYQAKDSDFKKATIRIYHNDSKIVLPVLK